MIRQASWGSTYPLRFFLVEPLTDLYIKLNTCEEPHILLTVIISCSHIFRCAHFPRDASKNVWFKMLIIFATLARFSICHVASYLIC